MIILGIETSCDDTCSAIIKAESHTKDGQPFAFDFNKGDFKILSNIISSQIKVHQKYGGVFPSLAKREHQSNLAFTVAKAVKMSKIKSFGGKENVKETKRKEKELKKNFAKDSSFLKSSLDFLKKAKKPQIDFIAVTDGPGLEPCLWQGINFAKALSLWWDAPLVPINHVEAHILANLASEKKSLPKNLNDLFPAICLIVSGGHTQLVLMEDIKKYRILGESRDDAAGECFDKTARTLGLDYPGGPAIYKIAKNFNPEKSKITINLPRPMIFSKNFDFSFSGLKTAVFYDFKKRDEKTRKSKDYIRSMAYEIQKSIIDTLIHKTLKAVDLFQAKSVIMGGGVTANQEFQNRFKKELSRLSPRPLFLFPPKNLSTDNAAMICIAALFHLDKAGDWKDLQADANLRINDS